MKTKQATVYVADDGREFTVEADCKKYEERKRRDKEEASYFTISHGPDLTSGQGLRHILYIKVPFRYCQECLVEDWAHERLGRRTAFVQGSCPTPNWVVRPTTWESFADPRAVKMLGRLSKPRRFVLVLEGQHLKIQEELSDES